jgi:hypothetical protein
LARLFESIPRCRHLVRGAGHFQRRKSNVEALGKSHGNEHAGRGVGGSFEKITGNFANHLPGTQAAPRGGDFWIAYPNASASATLRNLTAEAGFGDTVAAHDPSVY